ncbi:MAG: Fic family protein [Nitrospinae bacterium]|nr:Fic family protein [Nitrospinota bacterium]
MSAIIAELRHGYIDTKQTAADTRAVHQRLFRGLTPSEYEYYAGHYRGEEYRCLKHYSVRVGNDPRVGYPPQQVLGYMNELARIVQDTTAVLDTGHAIPDAQLSPEDKLSYIVAAACMIFEFFLRIHPYANGNGHAARFCIWAILGRYNYWPTRWPIEPRPADPPYTDMIVAYRDGNPEPLETYILHCLSL